MNITVKNPFAIMCLFIWIGFVCAISFMEAWLKFRAPGVTIPIGVGIGQLVFKFLNKVEWILALSIFGSLLFKVNYLKKWWYVLYCIPVAMLAIQSVWLLPILDSRANLLIQEKEVLPSNMHTIFMNTEIIKVLTLLLSGSTLFKYPLKNQSLNSWKLTETY